MQAPWAQTSDVQRAVAHHQQLLAQATMSATAAHPVIAQQMHQQAQQMQQIHQQPVLTQPQHPFGMHAAGNPQLLSGQMQQMQQMQRMQMQQMQQQHYMQQQQQYMQMPQPAARPAMLPAISVPASAPAPRPMSEEVDDEEEGEDEGPSVASSRARRETAGKPAHPQLLGRRWRAGLDACR